jgi:regulator of nucleoside diphosphate kinase
MNTIYLTEKDYQRLHNLVQAQRLISGARAVEALSMELRRAKVVASEDIPADVITMNSLVRLREVKSSSEINITIVFPKDADLSNWKISVLAPIGTAVLGCKVGDKVEWAAPQGTVTYIVEEVLFQPEAAGEPYL